MEILKQLSSQVADKTATANRKVITRCLKNPAHLKDIARGLESGQAALAGDCTEVMTEVAKTHPEWVAPYASFLAPLLGHTATRVRWEAAHSLALTAPYAPEVIATSLVKLGEIIRTDSSVIVRDYAVDAIGNYAKTSAAAGRAAYPLLCEALTAWDGKQAGHALVGLANVAVASPEKAKAIRTLTQGFVDHPRGVVRKAARSLAAELDKR